MKKTKTGKIISVKAQFVVYVIVLFGDRYIRKCDSMANNEFAFGKSRYN